MNRRCVIVGGADIGNCAFLRDCLREDDFLIYCDSGLKHREELGRKPDLIVGDFDSYRNPLTEDGADGGSEVIVLPCEKDDTDTVYAVKEAVRRGFSEFLLLGCVGGRLDHTLGNVSILLYLDSIGKKGILVDDYSETEIVSGKTAYIDGSYAYFSLLNITGQAEGITVRGAKYPLSDATITCEYQYGVSNEVLPGETASVDVKKGRLLLIKDRRI